MNRLKNRQNRAQERRETALRQTRIRQLENEIENNETRKHELEQQFAGRSDPGLYADYASVCQQLEECYAEYLSLAEEQEA